MSGGSDNSSGSGWGAHLPGLFCKIETSQPLKDARLPTRTRLYEEHHNSHKASGAHIPLAYGSQFKIATFNVRSLLKITMHRQIINHM